MVRSDVDGAGSGDLPCPLDQGNNNAAVIATLARLREAVFVPSDDLRAIGMELMRYGPPVGWLGAMLLLDCSHDRRPRLVTPRS